MAKTVIINDKKYPATPRIVAIIEWLLTAEYAGVSLQRLLSIPDPVRFTVHCGRDDRDVDFEVPVRVRPKK